MSPCLPRPLARPSPIQGVRVRMPAGGTGRSKRAQGGFLAQDGFHIVTDALSWPPLPFPYFYYLPPPPSPPLSPSLGLLRALQCRRGAPDPHPLNRGAALPIRRGWGTAPRPNRTDEDGWGCPGKVRKACGARQQKPPTTNTGRAADCNIAVTLDNYPEFHILRL